MQSQSPSIDMALKTTKKRSYARKFSTFYSVVHALVLRMMDLDAHHSHNFSPRSGQSMRDVLVVNILGEMILYFHGPSNHLHYHIVPLLQDINLDLHHLHRVHNIKDLLARTTIVNGCSTSSVLTTS